MQQGSIFQDARQVKTKGSKTFTTWFCAVGGDALQIVTDWCEHLRTNMLWGADGPLFPKTLVRLGDQGGFQAVGLDREHWSDTGPIRTIYKQAFEADDLPYFNPHCFRHALARLGEQICPTLEAFKAWSRNTGHEQMLTTLTSYGHVPAAKQAMLIRDLGKNKETNEDERPTAMIAETVRQYHAGG